MTDRQDVTLQGDVLPGKRRYLQALRAHRLVVESRDVAEAAFLRMGMALNQIEAHRLYEDLGYDTFPGYLASPDVDIGYAQARRVMRLARKLRPTNGTAPVAEIADADLVVIGVDKASLILPLVTAAPEQTAEWVSKARSLSRGDLAIVVREAQDGPLTARQEFAQELARKLQGFAYTLRWVDDPLPILDELLALLRERRAYLATLAATHHPCESRRTPCSIRLQPTCSPSSTTSIE